MTVPGGVRAVAAHYSRGRLLERLRVALAEDGVDLDRATPQSLAPYDQFHGRGLEATVEIGSLFDVAATDHLLDVGCGIGGPARWFAQRFGCRVTGIDLTSEFCEAATALTRLLGLDARVHVVLGDALAMPFPAETFNGAYSMNVSMNIADKQALYREIHRVLRPGGSLVLSEIARSEGDDIDYPTPWAADAHASFLATPEETRRGLTLAGFDVLRLHSTRDAALAFGARSRAIVERGGKPPQRAVNLVHGELAPQAIANVSRGLAESRIDPIEVVAKKRL